MVMQKNEIMSFVKKILILSLLFIFFSSAGKAISNGNQKLNITPVPLKAELKSGQFVLDKNTSLVSKSAELNKIAAYFAAKIQRSTGHELLKEKKGESNTIHLVIESSLSVNEEGYQLNVTPKQVIVKAKTTAGIFYGMQTLMQLFPPQIESPVLVSDILWNAPAVDIYDEPRFGYRGQHLDVCRHFRDVEYIKKQLDVLAMFKINKFHWHLTDDQGWRIEIKKYPKLMEIAAKRTEGEGYEYGPFFYTQEQIKEVVAYANERFIDVIPEIEFPGHAVAVLSAYPEYSCTGGPFEVRNVWGISHDIFCAGNDDTFRFIEDVIDEIAPLFPSKYFHIGGDEAPKTEWKKCPKCQARINELGIISDSIHPAETHLQSYFVKQIEKMMLKHNKRIIGWDEIAEGEIAQSAVIMSWRGEEGGIAAGNLGHDVIMVPHMFMYLDYYQGDERNYEIAVGPHLPLSKVYNYDPIPQLLDVDKQHHILGLQGNVWTEYMYSENNSEYQAYPRIIAVSETGWASKENKDYDGFISRLDDIRCRLDMHRINYYIPQPQLKNIPYCSSIAFTDHIMLEFWTGEPVKMVYTTNSDDPDLSSKEYSEPLSFDRSTVLKIRSVLPSSKMGKINTIVLNKQTYAPAIIPQGNLITGLKADYYKGLARNASEIVSEPVETEFITQPKDARYKVERKTGTPKDMLYNTILTGYIQIPEDGVYYFSFLGEEFWLDGQLFIDNTNTPIRYSRNDKGAALAKGMHAVKMIRLSNTVGGWSSQWTDISLKMRKEYEMKFKEVDYTYYFR